MRFSRHIPGGHDARTRARLPQTATRRKLSLCGMVVVLVGWSTSAWAADLAPPLPPALLMPQVTEGKSPRRILRPPATERRRTATVPLQKVASRQLPQSPTTPPLAPASEATLPSQPAPAPAVQQFDLEQVNAGLDIRPLRETSIHLAPTSAAPPNPAGSVYAGSVDQRHSQGWFAPLHSGHTACVPYQPLYFEEINLERYGYNFGCLQPVVSAAQFYGTLPLLPYKLADAPPWSCQSNLEHPPAATAAAPVRCLRKPINLKAAAVQVGVVAGAFLLIP